MAKTLLEEAVADAKLLKQTAIENAKNVLVEAISPKIKEFVESQLGECGMGMDGMGLSQGLPQKGDDKLKMLSLGFADESAMYEKPEHGDEKQDLDLMKKMGVLDSDEDSSEEDESDEDAEDKEEKSDDSDDEELDEMSTMMHTEELEVEAKDKDKEAEDKVEETVEITNEDLKAALSEVLSSLKVTKEARVTKGFGDAEDATIKNAGGAGSKGIADEKAGEHMFSNVMPPDAKDLTVKEAFVAMKKEIASLKKENAEYKQVCNVLKKNLQEVNLFNTKLLYTQRLLNLSELNNKQRVAVIEAFDRADNMREVELVYKSLSESFKIAGVLSESKQAKASKAKSSRFTTPSSTILKEAVVKEGVDQEEKGDFASRMQQLAGLVD